MRKYSDIEIRNLISLINTWWVILFKLFKIIVKTVNLTCGVASHFCKFLNKLDFINLIDLKYLRILLDELIADERYFGIKIINLF